MAGDIALFLRRSGTARVVQKRNASGAGGDGNQFAVIVIGRFVTVMLDQ